MKPLRESEDSRETIQECGNMPRYGDVRYCEDVREGMRESERIRESEYMREGM